MKSNKFNKIFCVGCHKTGTTSLHNLFKHFGLKSLHNTKWSKKPIPNKYLKKYTAFSDGGGHFWFEEHEFGSNHEIRLLDENYPNSRFILNTRNLDSWLISKMIHAGWDENSVIHEPKTISHEEWKYKSLDVIKKWIINRNKYHKKVNEYFKDRESDFLVLNYIDDKNAIQKITDFLGFTDNSEIKKPIENISTQRENRYYYNILTTIFQELGIHRAEWSTDFIIKSLKEAT